MRLLELVLLASSLFSTGHADTAESPQVEPIAAQAVTQAARAGHWPDYEPFTYTGDPVNAAVSFVPGAPATRATQKLMDLADSIDQSRTDVEYTHSTRVRRKQGVYHFDCSGMLNWMLERVSQRSLDSLDRERPVAATYVRTILKAPTTRAKNGWQNIADIEDVEPGDLFAWKRPKNWPPGGNTGHTGIVVAKPAKLPGVEGAYLVRVIDSTRYKHQDDTRGADETGWGRGTILFMTDADRRPIGYAWGGAHSSGFYRTDVAFGRIH